MGAQFLVINYILGITKKCKQNSRLQRSKHDSLNYVGDLTKCVVESHRQQHCDNGKGTSILLRIFSGARSNIQSENGQIFIDLLNMVGGISRR